MIAARNSRAKGTTDIIGSSKSAAWYADRTPTIWDARWPMSRAEIAQPIAVFHRDFAPRGRALLMPYDPDFRVSPLWTTAPSTNVLPNGHCSVGFESGRVPGSKIAASKEPETVGSGTDAATGWAGLSPPDNGADDGGWTAPVEEIIGCAGGATSAAADCFNCCCCFSSSRRRRASLSKTAANACERSTKNLAADCFEATGAVSTVVVGGLQTQVTFYMLKAVRLYVLLHEQVSCMPLGSLICYSVTSSWQIDSKNKWRSACISQYWFTAAAAASQTFWHAGDSIYHLRYLTCASCTSEQDHFLNQMYRKLLRNQTNANRFMEIWRRHHVDRNVTQPWHMQLYIGAKVDWNFPRDIQLWSPVGPKYSSLLEMNCATFEKKVLQPPKRDVEWIAGCSVKSIAMLNVNLFTCCSAFCQLPSLMIFEIEVKPCHESTWLNVSLQTGISYVCITQMQSAFFKLHASLHTSVTYTQTLISISKIEIGAHRSQMETFTVELFAPLEKWSRYITVVTSADEKK